MSMITEENKYRDSTVTGMKRQVPVGLKIILYLFCGFMGIIISQIFNITIHECGHWLLLTFFGIPTKIEFALTAAYTEYDLLSFQTLGSIPIIFILIAGYTIQILVWILYILLYIRFKRIWLGIIYVFMGFPVISLLFHIFQPYSDLSLLITLGYLPVAIGFYIGFVLIAVFYIYFIVWKFQLGNRIVSFFSSGDEDE